MKRTTIWTPLAATAFLLTAWGCGNGTPAVSTSDEEVQVKGVVTYNGKPLLHAKIAFDGSNIGRPNAKIYRYETQDDGSYTGTALVGDNAITVEPPPKTKRAFPMNRKDAVLTSGENVIDVDVVDDAK